MRPRYWFVLAGALGVAGLLLGGYALFAGSGSPRDYVERHYSRTAHLDADSGRAYTAKQAPSTVADRIAGAWKPADRFADASGVYLRYADDIVAITPFAIGALIMVDRSDRAYPRYFPVVGGYWGWPSGRGGGGFRGGGPGAGK